MLNRLRLCRCKLPITREAFKYQNCFTLKFHNFREIYMIFEKEIKGTWVCLPWSSSCCSKDTPPCDHKILMVHTNMSGNTCCRKISMVFYDVSLNTGNHMHQHILSNYKRLSIIKICMEANQCIN